MAHNYYLKASLVFALGWTLCGLLPATLKQQQRAEQSHDIQSHASVVEYSRLAARDSSQNRHVRVTGGRVGAAYIETSRASARTIWIPVFPESLKQDDAGRSVRLLVASDNVDRPASLEDFLRGGPLRGVVWQDAVPKSIAKQVRDVYPEFVAAGCQVLHVTEVLPRVELEESRANTLMLLTLAYSLCLAGALLWLARSIARHKQIEQAAENQAQPDTSEASSNSTDLQSTLNRLRTVALAPTANGFFLDDGHESHGYLDSDVCGMKVVPARLLAADGAVMPQFAFELRVESNGTQKLFSLSIDPLDDQKQYVEFLRRVLDQLTNRSWTRIKRGEEVHAGCWKMSLKRLTWRRQNVAQVLELNDIIRISWGRTGLSLWTGDSINPIATFGGTAENTDLLAALLQKRLPVQFEPDTVSAARKEADRTRLAELMSLLATGSEASTESELVVL